MAAVVVMGALCVGLYVWTSDFPMVFDDHLYLMGNPFLADPGSFLYPLRFSEFVGLPAKMGLDPDLATNFILRPVAYLSLHLNHALDGFNPRWFRVVNVMIHAANAVLIYAMLRSLLRHSPDEGALPRGSIVFIPATAALLFAAHPLATESVTYIIQRFTSLSTLFYLLTLWLYFASLYSASRTGKWLLRTLSVVVVVLGMLTKECVFTAPLMAVLIDRLVNRTPLRTASGRALPLLLCLPIVPSLVILTSVAQHGGQFSLAGAINIVNSGNDSHNHWHYIVTQITVVANYIRLILWPAGLNIDPDWPLHRSLLETTVLAALAQLAVLLAGVVWMWHRLRGDARPKLALVFTLWFFVTVIVSSGLVPLPDLMAEHRSYLPSIGIITLATILLDRLRTWEQFPGAMRALAPVTAVVCVGSLAWATCIRNEVWRTSESLWKDSVAKSPGKHRPWGSLGACYADSGRDVDAVKCYREALRIDPADQNSLFNLSNSLLRLNQPKEALDKTMKLIEVNQQAAEAPPVAYTLGLGLAGVGRYDDAIRVLSDLIATTPDHAQAHRLLGLVYLHVRQPKIALDHLQQSARLQAPDERLAAAIKETESSMTSPVRSPEASAGFGAPE